MSSSPGTTEGGESAVNVISCCQCYRQSKMDGVRDGVSDGVRDGVSDSLRDSEGSKLVKFHEESCEHQKRISRLRDEWYEKELLYSPVMVASISTFDSGLGISPSEEQLGLQSQCRPDDSVDEAASASASYHVHFDEELLIANIQNEAEVTQHMVDMMASTKTMRRRKELYDDLTYRRRSKRAKQTLSSYIPQAPSASLWGNIFDELMDRLRGRGRSQSGTQSDTPHPINRDSKYAESSSHSTLIDNTDDERDRAGSDDLELEEETSSCEPDVQVYQQKCDYHRTRCYTSYPRDSSVDRGDVSDTVSDSDCTPCISTPSSERHIDVCHEWVSRDEEYKLDEPEIMYDADDEHNQSYSRQTSTSSHRQDENGTVPHLGLYDDLHDRQYTAETSFTGSSQEPSNSTGNVDGFEKETGDEDNNNNGEVLFWEENWAGSESADVVAADQIAASSYCQGCNDSDHSHTAIKPSLCYKNQNCASFASNDSLPTTSQLPPSSSLKQNGVHRKEENGAASPEVVMRSISFRRPDLASFILPMSPIRKTESNSDVWLEREAKERQQTEKVTPRITKTRTSRWSRFKRLFSNSSSHTGR